MNKVEQPNSKIFRLEEFKFDFQIVFSEVFSSKDSMELLSKIWSFLEEAKKFLLGKHIIKIGSEVLELITSDELII